MDKRWKVIFRFLVGSFVFFFIGAMDAKCMSLPITTAAETCAESWYLIDKPPLGFQLESVAFGNGTYVAVGDNGTILSSKDGNTWTVRPCEESLSISSVTYGNSIFLAVARNYMNYQSYILTSPDGITWIQKNIYIPSAVTFGSSIFVAVGDHRAFYSHDGENWSIVTVDGEDASLLDVTYGDSQFVAVGAYQGSSACIYTSPDGRMWTKQDVHTWDLKGVSYGNLGFVAVGEHGTIVTSLDAITWKVRASGTHNLYGVATGSNRIVAAGDDGVILTSEDGIGWKVKTAGPSIDLRKVIFDGSSFMAVGELGAIFRSSCQGAGPICGDCSGDGTVTIGEVQKVINAFLGLSLICF